MFVQRVGVLLCDVMCVCVCSWMDRLLQAPPLHLAGGCKTNLMLIHFLCQVKAIGYLPPTPIDLERRRGLHCSPPLDGWQTCSGWKKVKQASPSLKPCTQDAGKSYVTD